MCTSLRTTSPGAQLAMRPYGTEFCSQVQPEPARQEWSDPAAGVAYHADFRVDVGRVPDGECDLRVDVMALAANGARLLAENILVVVTVASGHVTVK